MGRKFATRTLLCVVGALAALCALAVGGLGVAGAGLGSAEARPCDPIDPSACLLPYPSNWQTKRDPKSSTGRRLALPQSGMPQNKPGKRIGVAEYNRLDGFSPGSPLITYVPGLDQAAFEASGFPTTVRPSDSLLRNSPVLLLNWRTGKRVPVIAELDAQVESKADVARSLIVRPLVNLRPGSRYIVVLRGMESASGNRLPTSSAFGRIRAGKPSGKLERLRAKTLEPVLRRAKRFGVKRGRIQLAWDFTVASSRTLTGRMLSIRDRAFAALGDENLRNGVVEGSSPEFEVTGTQDFTEGENPWIIRRVEGTVDVPCFLDNLGCGPGGRFTIGSDGLPERKPGNVDRVPFVCNIPRSLVSGGTVEQGKLGIYGHGLLGTRAALSADGTYAEAGFESERIFCAMDMQGMSSPDVPVIATQILPDLTQFPKLADRVQQGILNYLFLGRAMKHPQGFRSDSAFRFAEGGGTDSPLGSLLTYSGDSQGGIIGAAVTSVAPDLNRGSLGVPGINYSTLLDRSSQWPTYAALLFGPGGYERNNVERPLLLALIQQLWDRAEGSGYVHHLGGWPLPDTPKVRVLLLMAYGDHQVANLTTEVEARTIGATLRTPSLDPYRWGPYEELFWRIPKADPTEVIDGNAMVVMDSGPVREVCGDPAGAAPPPTDNRRPTDGVDPHGLGGSSPVVRRLVDRFLTTGVLGKPTSPVENPPYYIGGWENEAYSAAC